MAGSPHPRTLLVRLISSPNCGWPITKLPIGRCYTWNGAQIWLDGQPTGVVTSEEEKIAAAQLIGKIARAKNRRLAAAAQAAKPASDATARAPALASLGGLSVVVRETASRIMIPNAPKAARFTGRSQKEGGRASAPMAPLRVWRRRRKGGLAGGLIRQPIARCVRLEGSL